MISLYNPNDMFSITFFSFLKLFLLQKTWTDMKKYNLCNILHVNTNSLWIPIIDLYMHINQLLKGEEKCCRKCWLKYVTKSNPHTVVSIKET